MITIHTDVQNFIDQLKSKEFLPENGLKQNHTNYLLVCLVNNLICLYLTGNFNIAVIFIFRIQYQGEKIKNSKNEKYINKTIEFLKYIKPEIYEKTKDDELWKQITII